ncbi:hypothetical protein BKA66DRAFT_464154 [Pyrenochaeta sp. MPI-SDFR-AT-0127]|nr:hypothetical protein BKA66DRAFT_464154 [Pyrenochaeta sp. MPI-SDFR-AT-0127]
MISTTGQPWLGQCIATPTPYTPSPPPTSAECRVGWANGGGCATGSTCTPIETCYRLRPCSGKCIATVTPGPTPPTTTECHVGWGNGECKTGSTCTPTMTCQTGRPCGGACIATPTQIPSSSTPLPSTWPPLPPPPTECHVGWGNRECKTGSTCTPTMTCQKGRPCGGACIATPTPPAPSACHA